MMLIHIAEEDRMACKFELRDWSGSKEPRRYNHYYFDYQKLQIEQSCCKFILGGPFLEVSTRLLIVVI